MPALDWCQARCADGHVTVASSRRCRWRRDSLRRPSDAEHPGYSDRTSISRRNGSDGRRDRRGRANDWTGRSGDASLARLLQGRRHGCADRSVGAADHVSGEPAGGVEREGSSIRRREDSTVRSSPGSARRLTRRPASRRPSLRATGAWSRSWGKPPWIDSCACTSLRESTTVAVASAARLENRFRSTWIFLVFSIDGSSEARCPATWCRPRSRQTHHSRRLLRGRCARSRGIRDIVAPGIRRRLQASHVRRVDLAGPFLKSPDGSETRGGHRAC